MDLHIFDTNVDIIDRTGAESLIPTNKPSSWRNDIVATANAAKSVITLGAEDNLYDSLNNRAFDKSKALMISGDFSQLVYSIRHDITFNE